MLEAGKFCDHMRRFVDALADLFLPRFCVLCGPCTAAGFLPHLCDDCAGELVLVDGAIQCRVCAQELTGFERSRGRCLGCFGKRAPWRRLAVLGRYHGMLAELIRRLKFDGERSLSVPLAELLAAQVEALGWQDAGIDAVIPIPLTPSRESQRGFNQAALIAGAAARSLDAPLELDWLKRKGNTERQVGHSATSRRRLKSAGFLTSSRVYGKSLLLIDDVVTTQSTIRAATRSLKEGGALEVRVLCCARTPLRR